jgi:hypothetical protein
MQSQPTASVDDRRHRAGGPAGGRRLRDGLFLVRLPAPLPGRHPQDRQVVRRRRGHRADGQRPGRRDDPDRQTLQLETVAEGVERVEQADRLRSLQCDIGQGYLFSRPLASDAITTFLRERAAAQQADAA